MRISRTRYESAKRKLSRLESCREIVQAWEKAMRAIGSNVDIQRVVAIEISNDGKVKWECETPLADVAERKEA